MTIMYLLSGYGVHTISRVSGSVWCGILELRTSKLYTVILRILFVSASRMSILLYIFSMSSARGVNSSLVVDLVLDDEVLIVVLSSIMLLFLSCASSTIFFPSMR